MNVEAIAKVIARKRALHPELARHLTWPGLQRICAREGVSIRVSKTRVPRQAQLVPYAGSWTIILSPDAPPRRHTYLGAHELGHLWLHHDATCDRWERVYNMDADWYADAREDDAELFASLVLMERRSAGHFLAPEQETALQHALRNVGRFPRRLQ